MSHFSKQGFERHFTQQTLDRHMAWLTDQCKQVVRGLVKDGYGARIVRSDNNGVLVFVSSAPTQRYGDIFAVGFRHDSPVWEFRQKANI